MEIEDDFVMPPTLSSLTWRRVFNSRFITDGPLGRGWSSWATTRLVEHDGTVEYFGPDGQIAVFIDRADDFLADPGIEAKLERAEQGFESFDGHGGHASPAQFGHFP